MWAEREKERVSLKFRIERRNLDHDLAEYIVHPL